MDETRFDGVDESRDRLGSRSSKTETEYEIHDQKEKTLEKYAQIQYFFKMMQEHNEKVLIEATQNGEEAHRSQLRRQKLEKSRNPNMKHDKDDVSSVQIKIFEEICANVNLEEERLPLWMCMTMKQKLDLFMHQVVEQEAQMLAFMLE